MTATDQGKVVKAGFKIVRRDYANLKIKFKGAGSATLKINSDTHEWSTLEKGFKNKAELDRRMKQLLALSLVVED